MSQKTLLHLSLITGTGPATVERLVAHWPPEALDDIYYASAEEIRQRTALAMPICVTLANGLANRAILERELERIEKHHINIVTVYDADYPPLLKASYHPPVVLYWRGTHPNAHGKTIAFVGSRKANAYAARTARALIHPLADPGLPGQGLPHQGQHPGGSPVRPLGICIVSGGALGADTLAHKAALDVGLSTIAVIGSGLLRPYPAQNVKLFDALCEKGGTLLSPFPLETEPLPANFPARNRIIAGLSLGCIVLQAAIKSGALITARFALDFGREVGAVPGHIDDELSAGAHSLLAQGAAVITSADDVLMMLGYEVPVRTEPSRKTTGLASRDASARAASRTTPLDSSDPILSWCQVPISFDDLAQKAEVPTAELHERLFALQLEGKVEQNFIGHWSVRE